MLPKHMSVKFCPNCGRKDNGDNCRTLDQNTNVWAVWCRDCDHKWYEQAADGTPPVEPGEMSLPLHMSVKFCPKCGRERDKYTSERCYPDTNVVVVWCHGCGEKWCEDTHASTSPIEPEEMRCLRIQEVSSLGDDNPCLRLDLGCGDLTSLGVIAARRLGIEPDTSGKLIWKPDPKPEPVYAVRRQETTTHWTCSACGGPIHSYPRCLGLPCPHCDRTFNAPPKCLD